MIPRLKNTTTTENNLSQATQRIKHFMDYWFFQTKERDLSDIIKDLKVLQKDILLCYNHFSGDTKKPEKIKISVKDSQDAESVMNNLNYISDRWTTPERLRYLYNLSLVDLKDL